MASDKKVVDHLEDWFDALVILQEGPGTASAASEALADRFATRKIFRVQPSSGAITIKPGGTPRTWGVHGDPSDGGGLNDLLRQNRVRRPLVVAEGDAFADFLEQAQEAFKVYVPGRRPGLKAKLSGLFGKARAEGCDPAPLALFDCLVAPNAQAAATIRGERDFGGAEILWSDDTAYTVLENGLLQAVNKLLSQEKRLNVLILYDDTFTHIKPVWEHLQSFRNHSHHQYFYLPAANVNEPSDPMALARPDAFDFDMFDVVVWHYSIRAALPHHMYAAVGDRLQAFSGLKVLFIQDEYDHVEVTWRWIREVGFDLVMTCAPDEAAARILYPADQTSGVELLSNLTGYVPEDDIEQFAVPLEKRELRLSYRGRVLAHRYGNLGREKYLIGAKMKAFAEERGVPADIEVDEIHRIYGDDWYRFQASARATLASESGANVVDFDGGLKRLDDEANRSGMSYEDFHAQYLAGRDGQIRMNQVSPKIFEAIRLRTALVCFEGGYSGVIQPDLHYIPLKKDFSNVDDVFAKLEDFDYLRALTDRAYRDVIGSGAWSHRAFVQNFDTILETRRLRAARNEIITAPIARRARGASDPVPIPHVQAVALTLNNGVLRKPMQRAGFTRMMTFSREFERGRPTYKISQPDLPPPDTAVVSKLSAKDLNPVFDGAVEHSEGQARVRTSGTPWSYAAFCALDLSDLTPDYEHCWLRVRVRDVVGEVLVGSYNSNIEGSLIEVKLIEQPGEQEIFVTVGPDQNALLFRNGPKTEQGTAAFLSAEVLSASAFEASFVEVARKLIGEQHPLVAEGPGEVYAVRRRPIEAPDDALVVSISPAAAAYSYGGGVEASPEGVRITTPAAPWSFGVGLDLDVSAVQFAHEYCWLRVVIEDAGGDLSLALWDRKGNSVAMERRCPPHHGRQALTLPLHEPSFASMIFRSGSIGQGWATLIRAELLTTSRYTRPLQALLESYATSVARRTPTGD